MLTAAAQGARAPELRFLQRTDLPNAGIRLKLMPECAEEPLPPPMTATYETRGKSGKKGRKQMYSPFELWIHDQQAGKWSDPFGNMLSLAIIRYPLPTGFRYAHAPREEYIAAAQKLVEAQKEWNLQSITTWVSSYLKEAGIKGFIVKNKPFKFKALISFSFAKQGSHRFAYAFQLNKSASGQQLAPDHWFFVYIEANPEIDAKSASQRIEQEFFKSIGVPPMSAEHRVAASSTFQVGKTTNLSGEDNRSDEFKRSREVVKQSIANLANWWFVETDHFIILSDLNTRYRSTLNDLQTNIEHLRYAYELLMPPAKPIKAVSVVRVPGSGDEYKAYVGPNYAWSGGIWMAARRELVIRPVEGSSSKFQKEQMLSTSYHEGFHQYLFYALDQVQAHAWFNEGHACFFEAVTLNNSRFTIGEHEYIAKDVDAMLKKKAFDLNALINMDYKTFYAGSDEARKFHYASAWLLVYYLRKHAEFDKQSPYSQIADKYFTELAESRNREAANRKAFEGIDINALQKDITEFWGSRNMRVRARYNALFKDYKPGQRKSSF